MHKSPYILGFGLVKQILFFLEAKAIVEIKLKRAGNIHIYAGCRKYPFLKKLDHATRFFGNGFLRKRLNVKTVKRDFNHPDLTLLLLLFPDKVLQEPAADSFPVFTV